MTQTTVLTDYPASDDAAISFEIEAEVYFTNRNK